jgi:Adenylosuccinate lyase (EC 4.3.2.2)
MDGLSRADALASLSPVDGRYSGHTAALSPTLAEAGLIKARVRIEVEYLCALLDSPKVPISVEDSIRDQIEAIFASFDADDVALIKRLETDGARGYSATNHDVKAVEYFIRTQTPATIHPWIHFGLTSEDVNNLALRLCIRTAIREVIRPEIDTLIDRLTEFAQQYRSAVMLARTHGQPATPTTFGKEMAVYASRLGESRSNLQTALEQLQGKFGGASGTSAAHYAALPEVDWQAFGQSFVESLDFTYRALTTQVNPGDDLAQVFAAFQRLNLVLIDLCRDSWRYISDGYLGQESTDTETGSSTMPHKVNPIDFENAEGNLSKANSDFEFLAEYIPTSRLQRDLSDSTVKRNIGTAIAHAHLGYTKLQTGLQKVAPNTEEMKSDVTSHPELIGEAAQTILRREGDTDAYERIKALSRGQDVSLKAFHELFGELDLPQSVIEELQALTPTEYLGAAEELAVSAELDTQNS